MNVYDRMKELGITLPNAPAPMGLYAPVRQAGSLLFSSGQGPVIDGKAIHVGACGAERTIEEGQDAARICALNILAQADRFLGDLNRITGVIKVLGFVRSAPGFADQPKVMNGASQLFMDIFGEDGRHARSAIGTNELPGGITVEVEAVFTIRD